VNGAHPDTFLKGKILKNQGVATVKMASALAKQLREIQQADQTLGGVSAPAGKRASFLFDLKEAADFDAEAIYELGMSGLQELQELDSVFLRFQPILFSSQAVDMDRALLTKKDNYEIDQQITSFLRYLSPYFLQKPAHKVLEWLIRKYRINEMNVEAVIDCILPYHETPSFVRMVQILYFTEGHMWGFLFDVKKNAKEINRSFLAIRCAADRSILNFVYDSAIWHAKNAGDMMKRNVHVIPFFTYLCLEYIENLSKVELVHVTYLLPMITSMIESQKNPDLQLAAFMLFSRLADKFQFSEKAMDEVLILAAKRCSESCLNELVLMFADILIRGHAKTIPEEALQEFALRSNAVAALKKAAGQYQIKAFVTQLEPNISASTESNVVALKELVMALSIL